MSVSASETSASAKNPTKQTRGALLAAESSPLGGFVTVTNIGAVERELERLTSIPAGPTKIREQRLSSALVGAALAVKDNVHVAGLPNTAATASLRGFVPTVDADAVARLRAKGMVVIGKTNMHEVALGVTSAHSSSGPVKNAVAPGRIAGGSSGGTAAVIGSGICEHGLGTDTGGSTRIPAAFNDIWGYRPTFGRYSNRGVVAISRSRDTIGPMSSSLNSIAILDRALAAVSREPPTLTAEKRLGVDVSDIGYCDAAVAEAISRAIAVLSAAADIHLVPLTLGEIDAKAAQLEPLLAAHELAPSLSGYLAAHRALPDLRGVLEETIDPHVAALIGASLEVSASRTGSDVYKTVLLSMAQLRWDYTEIMRANGISALLRPTVPFVPPTIEASLQLDMPGRDRQFREATRFTRLASLTGAPSLSVPLGKTLHCSTVGMLIDGIPGQDEEVFAIARMLERILGAEAGG